ncbi:MAG: class I SAM-dependent methyltransferase, partial [Flavisolibacter sp.]
YKKAWLLNVLHEIPDKEKMIRDALAILQPGGELILLELKPRKPGEKHGGCHQPLLITAEWNALFEKNGFQVAEQVEIIKPKKRAPVQMVRYVKK